MLKLSCKNVRKYARNKSSLARKMYCRLLNNKVHVHEQIRSVHCWWAIISKSPKSHNYIKSSCSIVQPFDLHPFIDYTIVARNRNNVIWHVNHNDRLIQVSKVGQKCKMFLFLYIYISSKNNLMIMMYFAGGPKNCWTP